MTGRRAYLALDLGTTELKGGLVDPEGRLLATAQAGYPLAMDPLTGAAEQHPEAWWAAVVEIVATMRTAAPDVTPVAIAVVGQGPTLVATDAAGRPVRPANTWMDTRSGREAALLEAATGRAGWALGVMPAALHAEGAEPQRLEGSRWYLNSWEWLSFRLSGVAATTVALGQRPHDIDAAGRAGLRTARLPRSAATGDPLGGLTHEAAAALGLAPGIPVVAGTSDGYSSFFGAGLSEPGDALDTGGTSGGFAIYWDEPVAVPDTFSVAAPIPGRWLYGGAMATTGKALDWLREDILSGTVDTATLLREAATTPPGAGGLVFLPYLAGERSPLWDPTARGAFAGLDLGHGRGHLARAVLEAAALALRHVADPIRGAGITIVELRVSGRTARSGLWNQIKSDVLGVPVAVPVVPETALMGAAVLAAVGVGDQPDLRTAMRVLVRFGDRLAPDPTTASMYEALFEAYTGLHPAIAPIVRRLREATAPVVPEEAWSDAPGAGESGGESPDGSRSEATAIAAGTGGTGA